MRMAILFLIGLIGPASATSGADFSVEGTFANATVVARDAPRTEVIAELLSSLDIDMAGEEITERRISGRYEGALSRILHEIAPDFGFIITHAGGKPRRVVFSGERQQATGGRDAAPLAASRAEIEAIMEAAPAIEMRSADPGAGAEPTIDERPRRIAPGEEMPSFPVPSPN